MVDTACLRGRVESGFGHPEGHLSMFESPQGAFKSAFSLHFITVLTSQINRFGVSYVSIIIQRTLEEIDKSHSC